MTASRCKRRTSDFDKPKAPATVPSRPAQQDESPGPAHWTALAWEFSRMMLAVPSWRVGHGARRSTAQHRPGARDGGPRPALRASAIERTPVDWDASCRAERPRSWQLRTYPGGRPRPLGGLHYGCWRALCYLFVARSPRADASGLTESAARHVGQSGVGPWKYCVTARLNWSPSVLIEV